MPAIHLRDLPAGSRFVLCRTGDKYTYLGFKVSPYGCWLSHVVRREFGDRRLTTLHHACHVKPVIRAS